MLLIYGEVSVTLPSPSTKKSEGSHWKRLDMNLGLRPASSGGAKIIGVLEPDILPTVRP